MAKMNEAVLRRLAEHLKSSDSKTRNYDDAIDILKKHEDDKDPDAPTWSIETIKLYYTYTIFNHYDKLKDDFPAPLSQEEYTSIWEIIKNKTNNVVSEYLREISVVARDIKEAMGNMNDKERNKKRRLNAVAQDNSFGYYVWERLNYKPEALQESQCERPPTRNLLLHNFFEQERQEEAAVQALKGLLPPEGKEAPTKNSEFKNYIFNINSAISNISNPGNQKQYLGAKERIERHQEKMTKIYLFKKENNFTMRYGPKNSTLSNEEEKRRMKVIIRFLEMYKPSCFYQETQNVFDQHCCAALTELLNKKESIRDQDIENAANEAKKAAVAARKTAELVELVELTAGNALGAVLTKSAEREKAEREAAEQAAAAREAAALKAARAAAEQEAAADGVKAMAILTGMIITAEAGLMAGGACLVKTGTAASVAFGSVACLLAGCYVYSMSELSKNNHEREVIGFNALVLLGITIAAAAVAYSAALTVTPLLLTAASIAAAATLISLCKGGSDLYKKKSSERAELQREEEDENPDDQNSSVSSLSSTR